MSSYPEISSYAELVDDLERQRIATENRLRALHQVYGISDPALEQIAAHIADAEKLAVRELQRKVRAHPLGPWINAQTGLGEKTLGRLLGLIGDPYLRLDAETGEVRPRTVSQLWAYCGLHVSDGKAPRRRKGQQCNWNTKARMRLYLIAESCMKQLASPYRAIYDRERVNWAGRDTTDLHKHHHALRIVSKEILKDLWIEARRQTMLPTDPKLASLSDLDPVAA